MAYTAWSVVFGEQPTTAKWNALGTNDAGFKDGTLIDSLAILKRHIDFDSGVWWEQLGKVTLTSSADSMVISSMSAKKFLRIAILTIPTGGTAYPNIYFNGIQTATYARRLESNGAVDTTSLSSTSLGVDIGIVSYPQFCIIDIVNHASSEKALSVQSNGTNTAGAGNVPVRRQTAAKWANTSAQITRVDCTNLGTGDYAAGSFMSIMGHN